MERPVDDAALSRDGLRVAIGLPSAIMLVIGGMVGVGVFVNPAVVARSLPSPALALAAWTIGGLVAILGALVYAELAARLPATGGEYVYLRTAYGPLVGFLFGWTTLLVVQAGGMAAVAIVFAKNVNVLLGAAVPDDALVIGVLAGLAAINCVGVTFGNGVQSALGLVKIAAIVALVAAGVFLAPGAPSPPPAHALPAAPLAAAKLFGAAMIPVVFSYGGWQTSNYVAGEVRNAHRNLAYALVIGTLGVIALYLSVNLACLRALGVRALGQTLTPASDVLSIVAGPAGARLAAAAIALSAVAFLSQSTLTGPRVYFAMATDGLFFRKVAEVSQSGRAPVIAILLQATWTIALALTGSYEQILSYVIAMNFLFFGLSASALFILRRREQDEGVHAGFRAFGHPWTTGLFILACALVVASSFWSYPVNSLIGYGLMLAGAPAYLFWRRRALAAAAVRA
jgi:APA family basic amino acid/polyamine antiporter